MIRIDPDTMTQAEVMAAFMINKYGITEARRLAEWWSEAIDTISDGEPVVNDYIAILAVMDRENKT